jgi:hypothetical protein
MKRIFTLLLLMTLLFSTKGNAQLSGVYTLPSISPLYLTLSSIITGLNTLGVSGPVTIRVTSNETAPSGGFVVGSSTLNPTLSSTNTLTFVGWSGSISPKTLTAQTGSGSNDAIFTIQGANYVTVNSLNLVEAATNTTATSMMERGYSIVKYNKDTGTKKTSILNCAITLNNANATAASGVAPSGAVGVFVGNCTYLSNTALGLAAAEDGTNDGTFVSNCTIKNTNHGIYFVGIPVIADGTSFNDKNLTVVGNVIENFTHHGVYIAYSNGDLVNGNTINNTASGGVAPTANMIFGVRYYNSNPTTLQTNASWDCTNNNINLTINSSSGLAATGVFSQINGTGSTFIEKDTIQLTSAGTTAQLNGIFCQNNLGNLRIANNYLKDFSTQTTNANAVIGVFTGGYSTFASLGISTIALYPTTSSVTSNLFDGWNVCSGTGVAQNQVIACLDDNLTALPSSFTNNTISNITVINNSQQCMVYGGVWRYGVITLLRNTTVSGNNITNITTSGATNTTPVFVFSPVGPYNNGHSLTCTNNKISKITTSLGMIACFNLLDGKSAILDRDTISDLTSASWHVFGVVSGWNTANYATTTISITKCSITNLKSSSPFGGAIVSALELRQPTPNQTTAFTATNNLISGITNSDTAGFAYGINSTSGSATHTFSNNMISDVAASANTTSFNSSVGINLLNSGTNNIFYNTVKMNTAASSATGYGASGLRYNSGATNSIQNNILHVNVVAGAANNVTAIRAASGAPLAPPSLSGFTASSNIYYTPTGANNYLYVEGTTNATLVNGYHQSGLTPNTTKNIVNDKFFNSECDKSSYHNFMKTTGVVVRERNTFTENNLSGTGGIFAPSGMSYAESVGTDVAVSDDFLFNPRPPGSSDIGALEFAGTTRPQMLITITSSTGFDTACTFNLPVLTGSIPAFFTWVSYQWYRDTTKIIGATNKTLSVTPLSGNYILKVYDSSTGCEYASAPYRMTIVPPPPAQITYYDSLTFCETSAIVLQANKGYNYTYEWMRNSSIIPGETNDHLVVDKSGDYMLIVNTPLGCASYSVPIRVKVYPLPKPTVVYGGPGKLTTQKYYLYQWYKNNVKIDSFATNRDYYTLFTKDGAYSVEVTDSNGCTAKSDIYLFAAGIEETIVSSTIKVFPNPMVDQLHINSPIEVNARLTDITGRVVAEQKNAKVMETASLAEGLYLLTLTDKEGKLIKVEKINKNVR